MSQYHTRPTLDRPVREALVAALKLKLPPGHPPTLDAIEAATTLLLRELGPQVMADLIHGVEEEDPQKGRSPLLRPSHRVQRRQNPDAPDPAPRARRHLVQEHLATVATLLPEGETWQRIQRVHLREGGSRLVFRELLTLARHATPPALRQAARACLGYLWRHRRRLHYALARARGYPIGSGRIESACKLVVQQRCKGPGMRWEHRQAAAVLHARCAWLNDDWEPACARWRATGHFTPPQELPTAA